MEYHELNPSDAKFELDGEEFTIRAFDLAAQVWCYNEFATPENKDGITVLSERISDFKDADAVLRLTWHLLRRKTYFGNYSTFLNAVEKEKTDNNFWNKIMEIYGAIVKTLGVSQPQLAEIKQEMELKKSLAAQG
jgi:hypothetical protein